MSILALSLPVLTALFFHLGFLLLSLFSVAFRREFSTVPMGLRSRGRKKHSVLCTKDLPNIEAYIETLTSGAKRNIKKADAELAKHNVFMTSRQNTPLHACRALPAYMSVILSHEQRAWGHWVKATLDSIVRWIKVALQRAILLKPAVKFVDIGPSRAGTSVSELKDRFGFKSLANWAEVCDYSGDFIDLQDALATDKGRGIYLS
eukprot:1183715-Prorocentrum_minimum.AAC.3